MSEKDDKDKTYQRDSNNAEWIEKETEAELARLQRTLGKGLFIGSDLKEGNEIPVDVLAKEQDTSDIAIDVNTGEPISLADNQKDGGDDDSTTETVVLEATSEADGLTINQILLAILNTLNARNKLAQETNKRLRDQNKILRKMAGLAGPPDKTIQGTPAPQTNELPE